MTYKLLSAPNREELEKKVNKVLDRRGELIGSPSVKEIRGRIYYIQAVVVKE